MELQNNLSLSPAEKGEKAPFGVSQISEVGGRKTSIEELGQEKIDSLKHIIFELETLIEEREDLSDIFAEEVEKMKMDISNFLASTTAEDADGFRERNGLRQKQIDISELLLTEKINCWRDVALLKKELRERQKELNEKEERKNMLEEILK